MKLRTLLIVSTILFVFIGVGIVHYVVQYGLLNDFIRVEEEKITTDMNRVQALINEEISRLDTITQDWAYWDDTYYFINDRNLKYIHSNINTETLIGLHINYMGFFNQDGEFVYDIWVDTDKGEAYPSSTEFKKWVLEQDFLITDPMQWQEKSGIVSTPEGILLISTKAILYSSQAGPARGTLILAHAMDEHIIEKIEQISSIQFHLINIKDASQLNLSAKELNLLDNQETVILLPPRDPENPDFRSILAYKTLNNIYGQPEFIINIEQEREIYQIGLNSVFRFNLIISVIGMVLGATFITVFEKGIIRRIEHMKETVQKIGETKDLQLRVPVSLNDEISKLSISINEMVKSLDQTQKEASRHESLFKDILENTNLITIILDREGILEYCNQYLLNLCGYQKEEILGKNWYEIFVPGEEGKRIQDKVYNYGSGLENYVHGENFILTKTGKRKLISWSNTPIKDQNGNLIRMASIGEDITLKTMAAEEIRNREIMLQGVLDAAPIMIALVKNGVMVWVNDKFEGITGYSSSEMVGTNTEILYLSKEALNNVYGTLFKQIKEKGQGYIRAKWVKKNGQILDIDIWAVAIDPHDIYAGTIVTTMDITEQLKAEETLKKSFEQVKTLISRMSALRNIDSAITSEDDSPTTTKQILALIRKTLNLDVVILSLYDNQHQIRVNACDNQENEENLLGKIVPKSEVINLAIQTNQLVSKIKEDENDFRDLEHRLQNINRYSQYAVVPLNIKGETLGILEVLSKQNVCHGDDCRDFLQAMAVQLAIALDNANLAYQKEEAYNQLQEAYESVIKGWGVALELRDAETGGHSNRVVELTLNLAKRMGYSDEELVHLQHGVHLHDIGKMGIPDSILLKKGPLTEEEWGIMRQHPVYAYNLLKGIPYLSKAIDIPYSHHERWNGKGYPQGLAGENIPLGARIFAVIDIWDALTSDRPYRSAWSKEKTIRYLKEQAGNEVDPGVVKEFILMMIDSGEISDDLNK